MGSFLNENFLGLIDDSSKGKRNTLKIYFVIVLMQYMLWKHGHLLMNIDFFDGSCDHIESILSITINAIDTPATEAIVKAHV